MRRTFFLVALCALSAPAHADIYECVDQYGNKRFTNIAHEARGCKALNVPHSPPPAAAPQSQKAQARPSAAPSPANFPRVDRATQQARDNDRRRILEQELGLEQQALERARQELAAQEGVRTGAERNYDRVLERLAPYQKRVRQHEDNVANLRREISKLR